MSATEQEAMFLRPAEAAALAGLSTRAIYRAIQRGELSAVRLCSRVRIAREGSDQWVQRGVVRPKRPAVEVRAAPAGATRGSLRRLLSEDERRQS